jgi:UDP-2-acetamido-2,6-beta-L-arabino-hexul-4-ose reductase
MPKTTIEIVPTHRDARGLLFEPVDDGLLRGIRNVHVVMSEPGVVRGNHRHLVGQEISVVVGPAEIRLKEDGVLRDLSVPVGETWRLTIPAGVTHAYRNPGPGPMVLIGCNSEVHNPTQPDAVREEIL